MKMLTMESTLEDLTGMYGPGPLTQGVLSDHVHLVEGNPALRLHCTGSRLWVAPVAGGRAELVLCSEIIAVFDEDGRSSGRCGRPAFWQGRCDRH